MAINIINVLLVILTNCTTLWSLARSVILPLWMDLIIKIIVVLIVVLFSCVILASLDRTVILPTVDICMWQ